MDGHNKLLYTTLFTIRLTGSEKKNIKKAKKIKQTTKVMTKNQLN